MKLWLMIPLLAVMNSNCAAQEPVAEVQQSASPAPPQEQAAAANQTLAVPAGTHVQLTLINPIRAKAMRKGDPIRAVTAFPLTVGNQMAIPAGTYVDGMIEKVLKHGPTGHAGLQVLFTRMVFANGYSVSLDDATAQARREREEQDLPRTRSALSGFAASAFPQQQPPPPPPPLPKLGPSAGEVAGIGIGMAAATTIGFIILNRHRVGDIVLDAGYQFEMVIGSPLALDAGRVAAAIAASNAQ